MARLSLSFLGPFQVTLDGRVLTGFESNKVRALLAYLAVESGRPHARETLAALLWPNYLNRSAANNLRSVLADLRKVIDDRAADPPCLLITRDTIRFNPKADYELDVDAFDTANGLTIAQLEAMLATYRDDFLEGFTLPDNIQFEEWLLARRETLRDQALAVMGRLEQHYEASGRIDRAMQFARQRLELDELDETTHRRLMHLHVLNGRRDLALAQYEACRRLLDRELGIGPGEETDALYAAIRAEMPLASAPEPPASGAPPFKGLSYFDEGDAVLFYGREALTGHLLAGVRDCLSPSCPAIRQSSPTWTSTRSAAG